MALKKGQRAKHKKKQEGKGKQIKRQSKARVLQDVRM